MDRDSATESGSLHAYKALEAIGAFFGSKELRNVLVPGRRREAFIYQQRCRVYPVGTTWERKRKGRTSTGIQRVVQTPHKEAIAAMRGSILSPPEVKTDELMAEYRKIKNKMKTLRRVLRG